MKDSAATPYSKKTKKQTPPSQWYSISFLGGWYHTIPATPSKCYLTPTTEIHCTTLTLLSNALSKSLQIV